MGTHTGPNEASALWLGRSYTATDDVAAVLAVAVFDGVTVRRYLGPSYFVYSGEILIEMRGPAEPLVLLLCRGSC